MLIDRGGLLVYPIPDLFPVTEGVNYMPNMNVVEVVLRVRPASLMFDVINHERDIARHPVRLNGRQVEAIEL